MRKSSVGVPATIAVVAGAVPAVGQLIDRTRAPTPNEGIAKSLLDHRSGPAGAT